MALLTIEGFEVPVLPGTELRDEPWGDYARAYSGRMRSDRRASHRRVRVVASLFDTADDAVALRTILNTPGPVLCGGTMIGDDAYFHVRDIQFAPQTVDRLSFSFELHETDDSPSPLLFSFDGDAPGTYTFTRSGNVGPFTNASGLLRRAPANVLRREYLWLDGVYTASTRPDTPAYLLEAARTNLVSSDNFDSGWTSGGSPVITASISDPAGGTGAYRIADDDAGVAESKYLNTTFTGNAVKSVVFVVREATMPGSGAQHLTLHDATAVTDRLRLAISAWSSGAPTVAAEVGTYLGKRYVGNGYWALYGQSTSITAANTNRPVIIPAGTAGQTGSIDVYRVNAYNATYPPWGILDASEAQAVETLYAPYTAAPQAMSVYVKFIEAGTIGLSNGTILYVGDSASSDARLMIQRGGSAVYAGTHDPGTASTSTLAAGPSWGDTVELLLTLASDGTPILSQSLNGATATTGTGQTAQALAYSWSGQRIYVGSEGGTGNNGVNPILSVKVARGVQSLAYMRDVAKGRLHPRTADPASTLIVSASVAATSATTATEFP